MPISRYLSSSFVAIAMLTTATTLPVLANDHNTLNQGDLRTAEKLRDAALEANSAYGILESLTTEVGPRLAGSEGDRRAIAWASAKFKELGFDRVWTETITIPAWERISASAATTAPWPQPMQITSLGHSVGTDADGIEAEIIHFATLADLMDAPAGAAEGKIVYISNRMNRAQDGSGYGPAVAARGAGAVEAAKKGAVAVLIRSIGTDSHRVPHTGMMRYAEGVTKIPAAALSNPDADILSAQIERGQPVRFHINMQNAFHGMVESANVIGEVTGSERPDEVIVLGSHLDSWDLGTGAIDDGAGVAITMAAGEMIANMSERPARSIRVIAFGAEEIGLWGGRQYADAHVAEIDKHIIGAESDFGGDLIYGFAVNVREEALPVVAQIAGVLKPLGIDFSGNDAGGGPDIQGLKSKGMAVANLYQDGTRYFDLHHTADDTFDKIDEAQLRQNVAAYVAFGYLAAQYEGLFARQNTGQTE